MKSLVKQIMLSILLLISYSAANSQSAEAGPVGGDGSNVVIGVLALIFAGFFVFLMMTDRKISRVEKEMKNKKS